MKIPRENIHFFYDRQYFCAVKIPVGTRPTVYMAMGSDNRPFCMIVDDIQAAFDLLVESYQGDKYLLDMYVHGQLAKTLSYKRATAGLKVI